MGFADASRLEHWVMEGYELQQTNSAQNPDHIIPRIGDRIGIEEGQVKGVLAPLSYHVLRLKV